MDNYEPAMVVGSTFRKLADTQNAANAWGTWDPEKFTVEDSAFGFVRMKNGAIDLRWKSSWALNTLDWSTRPRPSCAATRAART